MVIARLIAFPSTDGARSGDDRGGASALHLAVLGATGAAGLGRVREILAADPGAAARADGEGPPPRLASDLDPQFLSNGFCSSASAP